MDNRTNKEVLYDLFELGFTNEMAQTITHYTMDFIEQTRQKYNIDRCKTIKKYLKED